MSSVLSASFIIIGLLTFSLVSAPALADHKSDHSISQRIAKDGSLCVEGQECKTPVVTVAAAPKGPRSGEDVYNAACSACHTTGAAGAPKLGDTAAWSPRVNAGMASMLANALNGINGMPARGLCMDCTDQEIEDAIAYMVDGS